MTTTTTRNNSQTSAASSAGHFGLRNLVALLKCEGHRTLNGVSAFTLTTTVLQQLNTECRRHSLAERGDPDNTQRDRSDTEAGEHHFVSASRRDDRERQGHITDRTEWHYDLQFVKDFMQFSPNLKVNKLFHQTLVSYMILGHTSTVYLSRRLFHQTLVSYMILGDTSTDMLELCGGDLSAPSSWPQLKFVSLVFNSLTELDDSLRLMPHVQVLDLSHNLLQTCGQFLE
ncbi:unnamed protein product, partial [Candidula unifasciata]